MVSEDVSLEPGQGDLRSAFYSLGAVQTEQYGEDGVAHLRCDCRVQTGTA